MISKLAYLAALICAVPSAHASSFVLSGTATGTAYTYTCDAVRSPDACTTATPVSFDFTLALDTLRNLVITGDDASGYSFSGIGMLAWDWNISGSFVKNDTGYSGVYLSQYAMPFFPQNGQRGISVSSTRFSVTDISESPVPEPATWIMLALGLFTVGATLRRRSLPCVA